MNKSFRKNSVYHRTYPEIPTNTQSLASKAKALTSSHPLAVSGQGGHHTTFSLACKLARLNPDFKWMMQNLKHYNRRLDEQWTDTELAHKAKDAIRKVGGSPSTARYNTEIFIVKLPQSAPIPWSQLKSKSSTGAEEKITEPAIKLIEVAVVQPPRLTTALSFNLLH